MNQHNPIAYDVEERLQGLIAPLDKLANIHYMSYGKFYLDTQACLLLTNKNEFLDNWFKQQIPFLGFSLNSGWRLWENHLPQDRIDFGNQFNIGRGIYYINRLHDHVELFSFASRPDNDEILDFYFNQQNLLARFTHHVKKAIKEVICNPQSLAILPNHMIAYDTNNAQARVANVSPQSISQFLREVSAPFNALSDRESECYRLLIKGFTIQEISQSMGLSPNTVDVYVARIKRKLNCYSKKELIEKASQSGLIEYYLDIFDKTK